MLDIVITHYREPWEICRRQFLMLDMQRRVDWKEIRVTIINDGGYRLPEEELKALRFRWKAKDFTAVDLPHGGISRARNAGIDLGTEPWIMFCDCDDSFSNIYALEDIMNVIRSPGADRYDMLWTKCYQEDADGSIGMVPQFKTFVFCHGKAYRRKFLLDEGIRFPEDLPMNEDSCFNNVIIARTQKVAEIRSHAPVYSWLRRTGSVTTRPEAVDLGAVCQVRRNMIVTEENRLHREAEYPSMVTRAAYDVFYMIHGKRISGSCKQEILAMFVPWMKERADQFGKVPEDILDKIRDVSRCELLEADEQVQDSHETVWEWVRRLGE